MMLTNQSGLQLLWSAASLVPTSSPNNTTSRMQRSCGKGMTSKGPPRKTLAQRHARKGKGSVGEERRGGS